MRLQELGEDEEAVDCGSSASTMVMPRRTVTTRQSPKDFFSIFHPSLIGPYFGE